MTFTELAAITSRLAPTGVQPSPDSPVAAPTPQLTNETLRLWKAFAPLPQEQRRWALAAGVVDRVEAGRPHSSAGQVVVVVSGCLATEAATGGLTAEILGPGDVVSTGGPRAVVGRWITDGEVCRIALSDWIDRAGSEGLKHLLDAENRRRTALERRLLCATRHLATARVADLFLSVHAAAPGDSIPLSQEQLGAMLGVRRTTVNGSCRALEQSGASRTRRGKIRVTNLEVLAAAGCGCHHAE